VTTSDDEARQLLRQYRDSIDNLDAALVRILAERFRLTDRIGRLKRDHSLPAGDPHREEEQIAQLRSIAQTADLDPELVSRFFPVIMKEVRQRHREVARVEP
jgi:chorismate mutase